MGLLSVVVWGETGCVTVAGRILSTYTDTVRERDDVSPLLACVAISLWLQTTVSEVLIPPCGCGGDGTRSIGSSGLGECIPITCGAGALITTDDRPKEEACTWTLTTD
jgi:hypothetical protein